MPAPVVAAMRTLAPGDPPVIAEAFAGIGWNKPVSQYERYLEEQHAGERHVLVAGAEGRFAGYVTIHWHSGYPPFAEAGIPEIEDLNVLPAWRRCGIGTALMDRVEAIIAERHELAGIGVGMYPDYGAAQRMYVLRGYLPDGRGLTYRRQVLAPMAQAVNDDDLALYFTKRVR